MGVRGAIRDVLGVYLGIMVTKNYFTNSTVDIYTLFAGVVLLIFGVWFILERIGLLPKV
jgi:putative Mn2+ efflux pump MntP